MQYKNFWGKFKQYVEKEQCPLKFKYDNEKQRWTKLELGKPGAILELRPVNTKRIILAQIRFMTPETQKTFNNFYRNSKSDIESEIGSPLKWEENEPGKVTCKINLEESFDMNDYNRWQWAFHWIIEKANLFMSVFIPRLGGSSVSSSYKHNEEIRKEPPHGSYLPNREDFESAYRSLARPGQEVSIDDVLDKIASDAIKAGFTLKDQWRMITERNIREFWSKK